MGDFNDDHGHWIRGFSVCVAARPSQNVQRRCVDEPGASPARQLMPVTTDLRLYVHGRAKRKIVGDEYRHQ